MELLSPAFSKLLDHPPGPEGLPAPTEERIEFCFLPNVEPWPVKALVSPRILGMLLWSFVH